jgi:hypothetical protein
MSFNLTTSASKPADFDQLMVPFVRVPLKFCQLMGRESALLLAHLINWQGIVEQYNVTDGSFWILTSKIDSELGMSIDRQRKLLRRLQAKGFIRFKASANRWTIRIRYRAIMRAAQRTH